MTNPESYMVFHSPDLICSFSHDETLEGYVIYFKPECFSFFKPDFHEAFPFFNRLYTNLFKLDQSAFKQLAPHFGEVVQAYERSAQDSHMEARTRLLAMLYYMKAFVNEQRKLSNFSPRQLLLSKYLQLVNNHYIDKRTVKEYADLLSVTPNHLSQSVKSVSRKNALTYIAERLLREAKSLLCYSSIDISEIGYQLGFSDPANFGSFFKKHEHMTPLAYRKGKKT